MSQETISIQHFGGMVTNPHKEDIPDNMAVYVMNADPQAELGVLKGIKTNGSAYQANDVEIPDVYESDWINYDDAGTTKYDLIYIDTNTDDITAVENFYGAEAARTLTDLVTSGIEPRCVKTFNNATQIGNGVDDKANTVFRVLTAKDFFNYVVATSGEQLAADLYYEEGECYNPGTLSSLVSGGFYPIGVTENAGAGGYFQADVRYIWAVSLVYDGLQETNLTGLEEGGANDLVATQVCTSITVNIRAYDASANFTNVDKRITAVKLYRAESSDDQFANFGLFRLVKTIDINDGDWAEDTDHYDFEYDDNGSYESGATYEEETGMPETLVYQSVRYALNEVGGGYHWVTKGQPEGETGIDWSRYIFRSMKFRPNMFNWVSGNHLVLPEVPTALAWYNDRLYAFSDNTVYRINPELLYIEDTFFGAGASHRQSVLVSEYGLYFCNLNGAYLIKDSGIITISDVIAELPRVETYLAYKNLASQTAASNFGRMVIKAEVDKRLVLFVGATSGQVSLCLGYYIPTGQWYGFGLGSVTLGAASGLYGGKDGEVYMTGTVSAVNASRRLFGGSTYADAQWISKEFHLGEPSQNKSWNMIKWDGTAGTGTIVVKYSTEGTDPVSGTTATSGNWINTYKKTFQTYLVTTGNAVIDSLDVIVRRLFGKR